MVVLDQIAEAERDGVEPGGLRRQIEARGIGAANDAREAVERLVAQSEILDHGIERAGFAAVGECHAGNVERNCIPRAGLGEHLVRRHVVEVRQRIDEAADQPRAGDAVDLRPRARHPGRRAGAVIGRGLAQMRIAGLDPALDAAGEIARIEPGGAQFRRGGLAHFVAVHAGDDDGPLGGHLARPARHLLGRPIEAAADQMLRCGKGGLAPDVYNQGMAGGAEGTGQFCGGNGGLEFGCHGTALLCARSAIR